MSDFNRAEDQNTGWETAGEALNNLNIEYGIEIIRKFETIIQIILDYFQGIWG